MKYYTLEEIIKVIKKLLEHGWGRIHIDVQDHKIVHYEDWKSHKPEEGKDG
jgi:hypothetical protein